MIHAVAVVIPAHQEGERIGTVLASIAVASAHPSALHLPVLVVVAVDRSTDRTQHIAAASGATVAVGSFGTPARARQAAITVARRRLDADPRGVWVATTDADCVVPTDWISSHIRHANAGADGVAGGIRVGDWAAQPAAQPAYDALLLSRRRPSGQHVGVYGANLGVRLSALDDVGGFPDVPVGEDRALVNVLNRHGCVVAQPENPRVVTSARADGRAPGGLSALLRTLSTADESLPSTDLTPQP